MSVIINGKESQINLLRNYLLNYKVFCDGNSIPSLSLISDELQLSNKYYVANVKLLSVALGDACSLDAEGFILLPSNEHPIDHEIHSIGETAAEKDLGLRLLVALSDETTIHSAEAIQRYEEWAIENGFEYIEIGATDVTQGHQDREKFGLPRLMEALESNMWSTMQRRAPGVAVVSADPVSSTGYLNSSAGATDILEKEGVGSSSASRHVSAAGAEDAEPAAVSNSIAEIETTSTEKRSEGGVSVETQATLALPVTTTVETSAVTSSAAVEEQTNPFTLDMADTEENDVMDKFTDFISQVKDFRQLAASGQLGDAERRDQAAAMALRLSQMLAMGDDSSGDDSDA